MKKSIAIILIIASVLVCSCAFAGCKKTQEGSFVGAISQTVYESAEDAVKGFLEEEISGGAFTAEYVNYTKSSDLSQSEIDKLAIDAELKADITGAEKGEVEYKENYAEKTSSARLAEQIGKRVLYLVKYSKDGKFAYRFYVPVVEEDESLSKSYFNYVFDVDRYSNCTIDYNLVGKKYRCCVTENVICITDLDVEEKLYLYYDKPDLYVLFTEDLYVEWMGELSIGDVMKGNYENVEGDTMYLENFDLMFSIFRGDDMDQSYFVKTKTGYAMNDRFKEDKDDYFSIDLKGDRVSELKFGVWVDDVGHRKWWTLDYKFSQFGTTKVELPKELKDAVENYKSNK